MARPKVTDQRKEEILNAYEKCIAKFGVAGTTLAAIAEMANLSRPLVRHHAGNQDDLLDQSITRFLARTKAYLTEIPPGCFESETQFVDFLFEESTSFETSDTLIASAFITASTYNLRLREQMQMWLSDISKWIEAHLQHNFPQIEKDKLHAISAGLMGIYFNVDSFVPLGEIEGLRENSKRAALMLLQQP